MELKLNRDVIKFLKIKINENLGPLSFSGSVAASGRMPTKLLDAEMHVLHSSTNNKRPSPYFTIFKC